MEMEVKPGEEFVVDYVDIEILKEKLGEEGTIERVVEELKKELEDEGWFDIYQTVSQ